MNNNSFLAALNKELSKEGPIEAKKSTFNSENGSNYLRFPFLKLKDLTPGVEYKFRLLPPHEEKNPDGFIRKHTYCLPYELDKSGSFLPQHKSHLMLVPSCYDKSMASNDVVLKTLNNTFFLLKEDSERGQEFRDFVQDPENSDFKLWLEAASKAWKQIIVPVLMYATCDVVKQGDDYPQYLNYKPSKTEVLPRLLFLNDTLSVNEQLLENLKPRDFDSAEDYMPWNDCEEGKIVRLKKLTGKNAGLVITDGDTVSLKDVSEDVYNKLAVEDSNYPNLVETQLERSLKSPTEMRNLLISCQPWAQVLDEWNLIPEVVD